MADFHMPAPNEFICHNFDIHFNAKTYQNVQTTPERVPMENVELWYKIDGKFLLPHGFINCYFISPKIVKSIRNAVLVSLYSLSVKHYLTEKLYPARCAGLGHVINSAERGLLVKLSGYNEKLPVLFDIITKELKNIPNRIESSVFETYRKQLKKIYYNNLISPKFLGKDCRLTFIDELHDFSYDRYKMIDELTYDDLVTFAHQFSDELKVSV
jgi:nardilysin